MEPIKIPAVGESITEATLAEWLKKDGEVVKRDDILLNIETDKANVEVVAEFDGVLKIDTPAGETVPIGTVVGGIDTDATASMTTTAKSEEPTPDPTPAPSTASTPATEEPKAAPSAGNGTTTEIKVPSVGESITEATISEWAKENGAAVARDDVLLSLDTDKASVEVVAEHSGTLEVLVPAGSVVLIGQAIGKIHAGTVSVATSPAVESKPAAPSTPAPTPAPAAQAGGSAAVLSPAVRRIVSEKKLDPSQFVGTGKDGRLTKGDLMGAPTGKSAPSPRSSSSPAPVASGNESQTREKMTTIRKRIAERLVMAQQTAAILTTFNEIDMTSVLNLRKKHKESFEKRHGVKLGFMGLFTKACVEALREFPVVNAFIDGDEIVYNNHQNVGIAVGSPRGLIVPVIKNANQLSLADIELAIRGMAERARDGKITIDDLSGGTFTISNGGTYGSLMSTPILNPPQSGILGMHKTEPRPVVIDGEIVIRPMMYVALSYDHRVIDGEGAVRFLVKVKESLEDPQRILLEI